MTALRTRMIHQMQVHRLAPKTQEAYLRSIAGLARFYHQPPDRLTPDQIRAYLRHLLVERQLAWSSCNIVIAAMAFFYTKTLGWDALRLKLPARKKSRKLPEVLSPEEVQRLFTAVTNPKHRVLLMTTYAGGLRVSEVVRLRSTDIHSDRMTIRVQQAKGHKDRYTVLSERLLTELRGYWKLYRPQAWLFFGRDRNRPLPVQTAQKIYYLAKLKAGLRHGAGIHTLRHCFATHLLEAGVDPRTIQVLMGHRAISTTMGYLRITRQHLASVRSPFDLLAIFQDKTPDRR